eukprot:TRINITY_DN4222_c0_g1_i1.p3 TRINITY_DN4222_c0_g1~~TRINITY_DN4222_c0_g1_i1.p3  ORF type:complete len:140 (+),score=21.80 TRINITY_DN4222_c0_g1_i1:151-570(+)
MCIRDRRRVHGSCPTNQSISCPKPISKISSINSKILQILKKRTDESQIEMQSSLFDLNPITNLKINKTNNQASYSVFNSLDAYPNLLESIDSIDEKQLSLTKEKINELLIKDANSLESIERIKNSLDYLKQLCMKPLKK